MKHILCGNPNVGKTTFLNSLTGQNEHVGNWHGVTTDVIEKTYQLSNKQNSIIDLPGLYSLSCYSFEEEIARDYIFSNEYNIINLVDCNNLARNLYLTLQLLELGKNIKVCLNFANELEKNKTKIDTKILSNLLGTSVELFDAQNKSETEKLLDNEFYNHSKLDYLKTLPIGEVEKIIGENFKNFPRLNKNFVCIKVMENDEFIVEKLKLSKNQLDRLKSYNLKEEIAKLRYDFIDLLVEKSVKKEKNICYGYSKIDRILLNRFFAPIIFFGVIFLIFFLTFSSVGPVISDVLSGAISKFFNEPILELIKKITTCEFILSFFENGVLVVFSTLASFLPQIVLLFLFLSILEDTGYISRVAFTFDDIFSKVGLNGKSVFTLLMGFGCSTTACLTTRTLENKNSKIKATLLCGWTSCTAKIPLYSVILGAFFNNNIFLIFFLYFLGIFVSILISVILDKTILKTKKSSFVMELAPFRCPKPKRIFKIIFTNIKDFLFRVTGTIFVFSIIIWFLQNLSTSFRFISKNSNETSLLLFVGNLLAPIFSPLGFGTGGCVSALICGLVAKEVIVSSMAIINKVDITQGNETLMNSFLNASSPICFSPISAFSYLIFSLLYLPCIATIGVYAKEIGRKWTIFALIVQFAVAYLVTFIFYQLLIIFNGLNFLSILLSLIIFVLIIFSFVFVIKMIKKPKICAFCVNKKKCGR